MFESAVANVLNTVLGDYVANLESQQLNIGIWRGNVVLRNLNLRREALDKFRLPVDVLEGFLGELTLNIPWKSLKNRPIQVKIKDVFLLATPKSGTEYNEAEEAEREYRTKMRNLQTAEMIMQRPLEPTINSDDKREQTFIAQLVTKITDNLQFSIENIHIRYEDRSSDPTHPFAVGITLRELSAVSTDENWQEAFVHDSKGGIHKRLKLGSLALYCDTDAKSFADLPLEEHSRRFSEVVVDDDKVGGRHKYIMQPVSGIGRVILNKHFGGSTPKADIRLLFDGLEFSINEEQYRDALEGAALFQLYARQAKYRKFRPPSEVTPKSNPRRWLRFAVEAILYEVHDKQKRWSWAYFKERRDDRIEYIRLWSAGPLERPLKHDEQKRLEALERKLSFDDLRLYRSIARVRIRKERALVAKKHEDHQRRSTVSSAVGAVSWIGGWLKGSSNHHPQGSGNNEGMSLAPSEMSEEQRQQLYDTIEYNEEAAEHAFNIPEDTAIVSIRAHLRKGALSIRRGVEANFASLAEIVFVDVATAFLQRPSSYCASVELGGMGVQDGATEGTLYPFLVRDKDLPDGMPTSTAPLEWAETDIPMAPGAKVSPTSVFRMFYEHAPLDKKADDHVSVQARPLVVTFNPAIIEPLRKFFQPPTGQLDSIAVLIEAAGSKFEGLKAQTRAGLEYALDKHRTLDLQVQIDAPIFVFPDDVTDVKSNVLVVDSGHVAVRSEFASAEAKANAQELLARLTDSRETTGAISLMDAQLEKLLYDGFIVDLTSVQVLLGRSFADCIDALQSAHATDMHVLEQTGITTQVQMAIVPDAVNLTKVKVSAHLPSLTISLSDKNYKAMMRMLDIFTMSAAGSSEPSDGHVSQEPEVPYLVPRSGWFSEHSGVEEGSEDERDEFYDAHEHADVLQPMKSAPKDPRQRLFEFNFVVDNLSVTLKKCVAEGEYMDRVLADVTLSGFTLNMVKRPFDMTVAIVLRFLAVTDMSEPEDSEFRMLATSNPSVRDTSNATSTLLQADVGGVDLVRITYLKVQNSHPDFNTQYHGVDTTIDAEFTVLQINITTRSILDLYDFFLSAVISPSGAPSQQTSRIDSPLQFRKRIPMTPGASCVPAMPVASSPEPECEGTAESQLEPDMMAAKAKKNGTTIVKAHLGSVGLVLNNDGSRIATAMVKAINASVQLKDNNLTVDARLGGLFLRDDTNCDRKAAFQHLLDMEGKEVACLRYETYKLDAGNYPGYDASIHLRAGTVRLTFLEKAVQELLEFSSRFTAMHSLFEKARKAAAESAAQLSERATRLHFDVAIDSPVVVVPRNAYSTDVLTANLGCLKVSNVFKPLATELSGVGGVNPENQAVRDAFVDEIFVQVNAIRLESTSHAQKERQSQIIPDVDIAVNIAYCEHIPGAKLPQLKVSGNVKDISVKLTDKQYAMLLEISQVVGRVFAENEEDVDGRRSSKKEQNQILLLPSGNQGKAVRVKRPPNPAETWSKFDLSFALPSVNLELYRGDGRAKSVCLAETSLARFCLNGVALRLNVNSESAVELEFQIRSATVTDTRPDLENKFREIIPASSSDDDQFMVRYSSTPRQGAVAVVTVDSPKVIFVFDHLVALQQFVLDPLVASDQAIARPAAEDSADPRSGARATGSAAKPKEVATLEEDREKQELNFRVNIIDAELIVLDDSHSASSEAIYLAAKQVVLAQQGVLSLTVDQIGLFLCRMDRRADTTLRLIDNFDIVLSLDNKGRAGLSLTSIAVDMKPIVIRVSFRDALLAMGILAKANELRAKGAAGAGANQKTTDATSGNILSSLENIQAPANPTIVTMRESLKLGVQGLQLIMIDDLTDLNVPLVDLTVQRFDVNVSDWSSQFKAGTAVQMKANYFNIKNSAWEPLVEPWGFKLKVEQDRLSEALAVDFYSNTRLDVNIAHHLIETGLSTLRLWNDRKDKALPKARGQSAPYVFQNRTGYPLHMWPESVNYKDMAIQTIPSGEDLKFRFEGWRTMRENTAGTRNRIGLQFDGVLWESVQNVPVDRESVRAFVLRPKIDDVSHRLIVDIKLKENVKYVIFRSSLLIQNQTTVPLETTVVDSRGNISPLANRIEPGEEAAVPIEAAYHNRLKVRPAGYGYAWSKEFVYWRNLISEDALTSVHCESYEKPNSQFRFQLKGLSTNPSKSDPYPAMNITFTPPIELENLLPYPMKYHIYDKNRGGSPFSAELAKGAVSPVYFADMQHLLLLGIEVESKDFRPSVLAILNSPTDEFDVDSHITLTDPIGLKLVLGIHRFEIPDSGGAMKYSIYSPYVMLNKTGLDIFFKEKSFLQSTTIAAGQSTRQRDEPATPFMFSFSNDLTLKRRVMVKVGDSEWSKPLSFEAVGSVTELRILSASKIEEIQLGVSVGVGKGRYSLTKIVTFTPRFIVKNNMSEEVLFREPGEVPASSLKRSERAPLHFLRKGQLRQLTLCIPGLNNQWSAAFNIAEVGKVHVKLYRNNGDVRLVRADVLLEGATIFVLFNSTNEWPFKISNESDDDVTFHQHALHTHESPHSGREYRLLAGSSMNYSWDFPSMKRKLLILRVNGREREINIAEIGQLEPLKYPTRKGNAVMAIDVYAEENTQVLRLSKYNELHSVYRPRRSISSASIQSRESREARDGFEVVDVDAKTSFVFQVRLEGIGVSVINQRVQELVYASMRGMEFTYRNTTIHSTVGLKIKWFQIDNQLYGGLEPIILYPTIVPRIGREAEMHPTLQIAVVQSKDTSHGVDYYKYFSSLLQELSVDVDEDFLFALLDFSKFDVHGWDNPDDGYLWEDILQVPQPAELEPEHEAQLSYFEAFELHPLKLNISFVRTDRVNQEGGRQSHGNIIGFALNILTMAIGNINDAPIKLNALQLENLRVSTPDLLNRITNHYSQEFFYQLHKVLGSVDVLGNPVGLFNTISSGISDIFYEPYQGFVSDRPQDFGIGLARGATSFFKKTVYGVSDSFAKFTGSVGKGLSAATLDKAYQDQRRIARMRNRPKHVFGGVSAGANTLARSAISGLTGIVARPIEGAEQGGVGGLIKGVGKGLVGAIVKPAVGIFDLASTVTEGIRNTTTVFDENIIDRMRLPRFIGRDGVLRPYSAHDALGLNWLKEMQNGRYFHEEYFAHLELHVDDAVVMLTYSRIMLFHSARLRVDWDVKFQELRSVKCQSDGISVVRRNGEPYMIPIADEAGRSWFYRKVEEMIQEYNNAQRPLD